MNKTLISMVVALLGGALIPTAAADDLMRSAPSVRSVPAPIPGPGGVAMAVKDWLDGQAAGSDLGELVRDGVGDVELAYVDGALKTAPKDADATGAFFDVDSLGKPFACAKAKDFAALVHKRVATSKADHRVLTHRIDAVRANCHSAACSQAFVEFTRIYTIGGGKQMHVPMRATALLRYDAANARFVIYHWHASQAE